MSYQTDIFWETVIPLRLILAQLLLFYGSKSIIMYFFNQLIFKNSMALWLTKILILGAGLTSGEHACHTCLAHCKTFPNGRLDPATCDCIGNSTCYADDCFVKVEIFPEESTAIIQVFLKEQFLNKF